MNAKRLALSLLLLPFLPRPLTAQQFSLDPRRTYLHTNQDNSSDTVPLDLSSLGILPGDHLRLVRLGDWDPGPGGDTSESLIAIFSGSATLLAKTELHRVPGAIDAGFDFTTSKTYRGSQDTDVPEDFAICWGTRTEVTITVPAGASHLFLAPSDSLYEDNTDPDGDYGVQIEKIGPGSVIDLSQGLAGGSGVPVLSESGALIAADTVSIDLSNAKPNSLAFLVLGFSRWDVAFNGGTLVPALDLYFPIPTDALGGFHLATPFSEGIPANFSFFLQAWIVDPAAVKGMSASNALQFITP